MVNIKHRCDFVNGVGNNKNWPQRFKNCIRILMMFGDVGK